MQVVLNVHAGRGFPTPDLFKDFITFLSQEQERRRKHQAKKAVEKKKKLQQEMKHSKKGKKKKRHQVVEEQDDEDEEDIVAVHQVDIVQEEMPEVRNVIWWNFWNGRFWNFQVLI